MRYFALAAVAVLIPACSTTTPVQVATVTPDFETVAVASEGDAADDPAILVGESSVRLLGTDKRSGLALYDLTGAERAFLASGRVNNVDALHEEGNRFIAAASNRTEISLDLYSVDAERIDLVGRKHLELAEPYGLCMGQTPETSVFIGDKEGRIEHWVVDESLRLELRDQYLLQGQTEGCVFDPVDGTLYVGEEERGIWAFDLETGERQLIAAVDGSNLVMDVEGLDIYHATGAAEGIRYLVASSQGDNSYLIYAIPGGEQLLKFRIVDDVDAGIDGTEETDGLAVTSAMLPGYPAGILVVQDGANVPARQNFKGVDWRKIQALLP
jgi:3-phytase